MTDNYLIELGYNGISYHGWQKQKNVVTIQGTIEFFLKRLFPDKKIQTIAASRTDSMVSANQSYFLLRVDSLLSGDDFLYQMNNLLPLDIRLKSIIKVNKSFSIVRAAYQKEYLYSFTFGGMESDLKLKTVIHFKEDLDVILMNEAASVFLGDHSFHNFCHKNRRENTVKKITLCEIYPVGSGCFIFRVIGNSFMRHQVRLMMGALINVGLGKLDINDLRHLLSTDHYCPQKFLVPAAGLCLQRVEVAFI